MLLIVILRLCEQLLRALWQRDHANVDDATCNDAICTSQLRHSALFVLLLDVTVRTCLLCVVDMSVDGVIRSVPLSDWLLDQQHGVT